MIQVAGTVLVVVSAALAWAVCILYHFSARWWEREAGWHIMTFTGTLAAVLTLWAVGAVAPARDAWWEVLRLVAFTGVPISLGWRLWIVYRLQVRPALKKSKET